MLPLRRAAPIYRSVSPQASPRAMVSSSGADCQRDAAAECTEKQNITEKQANSNKGEAAVAASPTDSRQVKQEERSEQEVRKRKAAGKPAVATSQSETVVDETARPGTDA